MELRRPYEEVYLALEECSPGVKGALERLGGEVDRLAGRCRELEDALLIVKRRDYGALNGPDHIDPRTTARVVMDALGGRGS